MMELSEARKAVRAVDEEMAKLFARRMEAVKRIAAYKLGHGLPVEDPQREKETAETLGALIDDAELRPYYLRFLESTVELSKSYQRSLISASEEKRR